MPFSKQIHLWLLAAAAVLLCSGLPAPPAAGGDFDLALYQVKSKKVQRRLGSPTIAIRKESFPLSDQTLPLLELQGFSDEQAGLF